MLSLYVLYLLAIELLKFTVLLEVTHQPIPFYLIREMRIIFIRYQRPTFPVLQLNFDLICS